MQVLLVLGLVIVSRPKFRKAKLRKDAKQDLQEHALTSSANLKNQNKNKANNINNANDNNSENKNPIITMGAEGQRQNALMKARRQSQAIERKEKERDKEVQSCMLNTLRT